MTQTAWRRILWLTLVAVVPLPMVIVGPGSVPAARMLMLGAITTLVMVAEQAGGAAPLLAPLFFAQGLVYAGLLWLTSFATVRLVARLGMSPVPVVALAVVVLLATASFMPLYVDPYQAMSPRTDLLHVYR